MNEARGLETMSPAISKIRGYFDWLYERLSPYLGDSILEIGPGYGNIAERLLANGKTYMAIDTDPEVIAHIASQFPQIPHDHLITGDITSPALCARIRSLRPDCILSMNVLEHIQDDAAHLRSLASSALVNRYIFLVPAMTFLYGSFDSEAGHYRRYMKSTLSQVLRGAGFHLVYLSYFNAIGAMSWWAASTILRLNMKSRESERAIIAYDKLLVPIARLGDPFLRPFMGQSLIAVAALK